MLDGRVLSIAAIALVVGVPIGFFKEKTRKNALKRWALNLLPVFATPMLTSQEEFIAAAASLFIGRMVGASFVAVGLTGGIATGKSAVSNVFQRAGGTIIDADVIARQVVLPGHGAYKEIVRTFGEDVLNPKDKTIDRGKLGQVIFADPAKREQLNKCTHKYIIWEMFRQLVYERLIARRRLVVFDAPLLFETKILSFFCYPIVVVVCSEENETQRLMKRNDLSREDAERRIKSQMNLAEKEEQADLVIHNDGSMDQLLYNAQETLFRTAKLVGGNRELHSH